MCNSSENKASVMRYCFSLFLFKAKWCVDRHFNSTYAKYHRALNTKISSTQRRCCSGKFINQDTKLKSTIWTEKTAYKIRVSNTGGPSESFCSIGMRSFRRNFLPRADQVKPDEAHYKRGKRAQKGRFTYAPHRKTAILWSLQSLRSK